MNRPSYGIDLGRTDMPLQHRYFLWAVIALFMVVAVWMGSKIGSGSYQQPMMVVAVLFGLGIGLWMGEKVWLLVPVAFLFNIGTIPVGGRTIELSELACAGVAFIALLRFATRSQPLRIFRSLALGVVLYFLWAMFILVMNPVGLAVMGSADVGLRFYFKIALGFSAFLVMSNQKIGEWECQFLIRMTLIGSVFSAIVDASATIAGIRETSANTAAMGISGYSGSEGEGYTWHQSLSGPAMIFTAWMFSRYRSTEIFSIQRFYLPLIYLVALVLALYSGKRVGFAMVLVFPLIALIVHKEWKAIMLSGVLAILGISFLVAGHGSLFNLPFTVQRALSTLPGTDGWEAKRGFAESIDPFRDKMRELAWTKIQENPVIGKGFGLDVKDYLRIVQSGDFMTILVLGLAMGSSWHNTWLGYWADFGFPAIVFWAIFRLQFVWLSWKTYKLAEPKSAIQVLALMFFISSIEGWLTSWTSGHSANDPYSQWWRYGFIVSLYTCLCLRRVRSVQPLRKSETKAYGSERASA